MYLFGHEYQESLLMMDSLTGPACRLLAVCQATSAWKESEVGMKKLHDTINTDQLHKRSWCPHSEGYFDGPQWCCFTNLWINPRPSAMPFARFSFVVAQGKGASPVPFGHFGNTVWKGGWGWYGGYVRHVHPYHVQSTCAEYMYNFVLTIHAHYYTVQTHYRI